MARSLVDLPSELLVRVALHLPSPADAQRFMRQTSRALQQRLAGHVGAFPVAWLLHNYRSRALTRAARRGDTALILALLAAPGERLDRDGALAAAARAGHVAAVRVLLAAGADPNAALLPAVTGREVEADGWKTAAACTAGRRDTVRALVRAGADPFRDSSGAAIRAAVKVGDEYVFRNLLGHESHWLLDHGSLLAFVDDDEELDTIMLLLLHPLVTAVRAGGWPAVQEQLDLLDDSDGDSTSSSDDGLNDCDVMQAAVEAAAAAGQVDVALRLLHVADEDGWRVTAWRDGALAAAACRGRWADMRRLIWAGATAVTDALEEASHCGQLDAVVMLLANGARVDPSMLGNAAWAGDVDVLQVLMRAGSGDEVDLQPALKAAARGGRAEAVQALLKGWPGGCPAHALDKALKEAEIIASFGSPEAAQVLRAAVAAAGVQ